MATFEKRYLIRSIRVPTPPFSAIGRLEYRLSGGFYEDDPDTMPGPLGYFALDGLRDARHTETDVEPICTVVLCSHRMTDEWGQRRVAVDFNACYYSRTCPLDGGGVDRIGYEVESSRDGAEDYLVWFDREWRATGLYPNSGFYVARESEWLSSPPERYRDGYKHYVLEGRDGFVELVARRFKWREWIWKEGRREDAPSKGPVVDHGEGVTSP